MLCGAQAGYAATGMGEGVSGWDSLGDDRLEVQHDGDHGAGSAGRALSAIPMTPPSMTRQSVRRETVPSANVSRAPQTTESAAAAIGSGKGSTV